MVALTYHALREYHAQTILPLRQELLVVSAHQGMREMETNALVNS